MGQLPVQNGCVVGDDIPATGSQKPGWSPGYYAGIGDYGERGLSREGYSLSIDRQGGLRRADAIMRSSSGEGEEGDARSHGCDLGDINRSAPAWAVQ